MGPNEACEIAEIDADAQRVLNEASRNRSDAFQRTGSDVRHTDAQARFLRAADLPDSDVDGCPIDNQRASVGLAVPTIDQVLRTPPQHPDRELKPERWHCFDVELQRFGPR